MVICSLSSCFPNYLFRERVERTANFFQRFKGWTLEASFKNANVSSVNLRAFPKLLLRNAQIHPLCAQNAADGSFEIFSHHDKFYRHDGYLSADYSLNSRAGGQTRIFALFCPLAVPERVLSFGSFIA